MYWQVHGPSTTQETMPQQQQQQKSQRTLHPQKPQVQYIQLRLPLGGHKLGGLQPLVRSERYPTETGLLCGKRESGRRERGHPIVETHVAPQVNPIKAMQRIFFPLFFSLRNCQGSQPKRATECNRTPCPGHWKAVGYTPCSSSCGPGLKKMKYECVPPEGEVFYDCGIQPRWAIQPINIFFATMSLALYLCSPPQNRGSLSTPRLPTCWGGGLHDQVQRGQKKFLHPISGDGGRVQSLWGWGHEKVLHPPRVPEEVLQVMPGRRNFLLRTQVQKRFEVKRLIRCISSVFLKGVVDKLFNAWSCERLACKWGLRQAKWNLNKIRLFQFV